MGLTLSATGGLAWLGYNCPKIATRLLFGLLVCSMLIQMGLTSYECGYRACEDYISKRLSKTLGGLRLSKKKRMTLYSRLVPILQSAARKFDDPRYNYRLELIIATAILLVLMVFSIFIDKIKQN